MLIRLGSVNFLQYLVGLSKIPKQYLIIAKFEKRRLSHSVNILGNKFLSINNFCAFCIFLLYKHSINGPTLIQTIRLLNVEGFIIAPSNLKINELSFWSKSNVRNYDVIITI